MLGQLENLLKPESKEKREKFLKDCGFSEKGIEEVEKMENQKEKYELFLDLWEHCNQANLNEERLRITLDKKYGLNASEDAWTRKKAWPHLGD